MITTKAYITQTPAEGDNKFKVNIPLMSDNVSDEAIFDALLCSTSGNYNDYKVGDCVFVDFEDDKYNTAIIMGKLYTEVPEENEAYGLFNELKVTGNATLPANTMIGPYSAQDIFNLYQAVNNAKEGNWVDEDSLFEYLKVWVKKDEFNTFFSDNYFNSEYPYNKSFNFDNILEKTSGTGTDKKYFYNTSYSPDYKNLVSNWKNFIITQFNKFLGIKSTDTDGTFTRFLTKINNDSESQDASTKYFPDYTNFITRFKKVIFVDIPAIYNVINDLVNKYVQFKKNDSWSSLKQKHANIIRTMTGADYDNRKNNADYNATEDASTLYFLTTRSSSN